MASKPRAGSSSSGSSDAEAKTVLPADHLMFRLLGDFKEHTKVKIDIFIRDDKIRIEDFFDGSDAKTFNNVLEGLTEVSKYYLNLISNALLQWRSSQHVIPAKSISKPKLDGSDTKRDSITPLVDERYKLIVDYIFCISLLTILNSLTKDNLNDQIGTQIESICFDNFKLERRTASPIIPDLCASILGQLSKYRLRSVSTRFFKEFQLCQSSNTLKAKALPIVQGIRFFKVKISSNNKLKQTLEFLTSYQEFFKNSRIKGDLRRSICEVLASILRPLTEEKFASDVNYNDWVACVKEMYDFVTKKTKKTKDILTSYPLLTILLCCGDKEFFLKNFWGLMDSFIKIKDKQIRPFALESSQYLLECYLSKYSEQPEEVHERLHQVVSHVFPTGHSKKLTLGTNDSLDVFIDMVCVIANTRIDFAFEKIIFDLLRGGDPKDYITTPERMIVGLRAVLLIDGAASNPLTPKLLSFANGPSQSPASPMQADPAHKARAVRRVRYGTLKRQNAQPVSPIEPYLKSLSIFLSQILQALDITFGQLLTSNQTKPLNELLEKLRPPGPSCIELLKIAISVIPIAFPAKLTAPELVYMLSKYLIHLDKGVCEKASIVLTQLMASRPDLRTNIIGGLGKYALSLSDRMSPLTTIVLEKMRELLEMWARSKSNKYRLVDPDQDDMVRFKPDVENHMLDVTFVESVGIVFLCSSSGRVRRVALSILDSIRAVHEAFLHERQDDIIEISTHIRDIIDENGNEYLYRHAQTLTNTIENKYKKQKTPQDFERVSESETKEDQLLWSTCLSDIARASAELCLVSTLKATELIMQRIKPIWPEEKQQNTTGDAEGLSIWWRNYIIVACATIQVTDNTAIDIKKKMTDIVDQAPVSARELFTMIIPNLKSADKFFVDASLMALEKTHPRVLEVLFDIIKPYEHEIHVNKKTKKKAEGLRSVIAIRRHCLESLKPGELVQRDILKRSYIEFIQEVLQFLALQENNGHDYLWDSLHYIRFNFCALVHRTIQQLYIGAKEFLDKNLRKELFRVFSKWSESEEFLGEESTSRRLTIFLQQEEKESAKRKEYELRIVEHATQLSNVASHAVSVILLGPQFIETFREPNGVIFQWINFMFVSRMKSKIRSVSRLALQNFLKCNLSHTELIYHCVNQCYSSSSGVASGYFLSLVELCQDQVLKFSYSDSILTNLVIFNSGSKLSYVRQQAMQLLYFMKASAISSTTGQDYSDGYYPSAIGSDISDTYLYAQFELSETLALENPELCYEVFMDIVYRLDSGTNLGNQTIEQMLNYVLPWLDQMNLEQLSTVNGLLLDSVMQGLVLITMRYTFHMHLVEKIWKILGNRQDNIPTIIDFILGVIEKTRNNDLIPYFKRICVFLSRSSPQTLVDSLVSELTSTSASQTFTVEYGESKSIGKATAKYTNLSQPIQLQRSTPIFDAYNTTSSINMAFHQSTDLMHQQQMQQQQLHQQQVLQQQSSMQQSSIPLSQGGPQSIGQQGSASLSTTNLLANTQSNSMNSASTIGSTVVMGSVNGGNTGTISAHTSMVGGAPSQSNLANVVGGVNIVQNRTNYPLSRFQLPLIFLSEVAFEIGEEFRKHLPTLLQLIFLGLYYHQQPVHEHCRLLLLNLIRCLVIKKCQQNGDTNTMLYEDAIQLADFLMPSRSPDGDIKEIAKKEISSPKYVVMLTKRVVSVLSNGSTDLKEYWGVNALNWATNSQNNRLAQRSYQILRGLEPTATIDAFTEVLTSLGKHLATLSQDNISLVGEIQETLLVMVRCIHPSKLILFPQLFWGTMALLQSDFESQFINAIKLLTILLETVNFSDRAVQNVFLASQPKEWDFFHGLQPMVLRGLMSTNTSPITIEFLSAITLQPCNEIFHPEPIRFLTNLTSLLPFLLYSITEADQDHLAYTVAERLSTASENHNCPRLSTIFQNYCQQIYLNQLDSFLDDLTSPLCDVVVKHSTLVFSLLFNILEFGPPDYRYPILRLLTRLIKGGVNPSDTKSSRVADWYDTITIFINDHKTPNYIVSQCLRLAEISSEKSPTSLTSIDNAAMKPSRSAFTNTKKFSNKVERGSQIASGCLSKVLDSCGARNTSLTKSMYFNTQIFEKFFSSTDDMIPPQKAYDTIDDLESESSSNAPLPGSENENDGTDTIHSMNDLNSSFDMGGGGGAEFHNFPHFQGFNDILEGLGDMSIMNTSTISSTSGVNSSHTGTIGNRSATILDQSQSTVDISDTSSNESSSSMSFSSNSSILGNNPPMTPIHSTRSPSSSSLLTPISSTNASGGGANDRSNINAGGSISNPLSPTFHSTSITPGSIKSKMQSQSSPTLSRNMQFQTNSTLSTLSYNITAAKSWWNSCSEQIDFQSDKELFDLFVAAVQLVQQISSEYKTLFNQCLPLVSSVASEVSALSVDIFEKSTFTQAIHEIQSTSSMAEKYKKALELKPSLNKLFMEQRERAIETFTTQLNVYTEQRTSTNNTRAKLFENGISNNELQIQLTEARFCYAICNLYQHLLNLWNAHLSLEEIIVDYVSQDLHIEKQREEIKKELNKCKVLAVLIKEKESDLTSKNLQYMLSNSGSSIPIVSSTSSTSSTTHIPASPSVSSSSHHHHGSGGSGGGGGGGGGILSSPTVLSTPTPITTSPSLSSPTLLDESSRLSGADKRRRSSTRPEPNPK